MMLLLTTLGVRSQKIYDLDAGHQNLLGFALFGEKGGGTMDGGLVGTVNGTLFVHGFA